MSKAKKYEDELKKVDGAWCICDHVTAKTMNHKTLEDVGALINKEFPSEWKMARDFYNIAEIKAKILIQLEKLKL